MLLDLLGINKVIKQMKCKLQKLESNNSSTQVNSDWNATSGVAQILNKPYKSYVAIVNHQNTSVPQFTILQNEIGNIIWTYVGVGIYKGTFINFGFSASNKLIFNANGGQSTIDEINMWHEAPTESVLLVTKSSGVNTNSIVKGNIEIRLYN